MHTVGLISEVLLFGCSALLNMCVFLHLLVRCLVKLPWGPGRVPAAARRGLAASLR